MTLVLSYTRVHTHTHARAGRGQIALGGIRDITIFRKMKYQLTTYPRHLIKAMK